MMNWIFGSYRDFSGHALQEQQLVNLSIKNVLHEVLSDFTSSSLQKLKWSVNISLRWLISQLQNTEIHRVMELMQKSSEDFFELAMIIFDVQGKNVASKVLAANDFLPKSTGYSWKMFLEVQRSLTADEYKAFLSMLEDELEHLWKHNLEEADHSQVVQLLEKLFCQDPIVLFLILEEMGSLNLIHVSPKRGARDAFRDLDHGEFEKLKAHLKYYLPHISLRELEMTSRHGIAGLMKRNSFRSCVELTEKVLKRIERLDLVSKLPHTSFPSVQSSECTEHIPAHMVPIEFHGSSGTKGACRGGPVFHGLVRAPSASKNIMSRMWSNAVLLSNLSEPSWQCFQKALPDHLHVRRSALPVGLLRQEAVLWVVLQHDTQSLYKVAVVLVNMGLSAVAQGLLHSDTKDQGFLWGTDNDDWCKILSVLADKVVLLDTVHELSYREMSHFEWFVQFTCLQQGVSWIDLECERQSQVFEMMASACSPITTKEACAALMRAVVVKHGQQAADLMRHVFMNMGRDDVGERLRHGFTVKYWFEMGPALKQKIKEVKVVIKRLMKTLGHLNSSELMDLKHALTTGEHATIPWYRLCHYEKSHLVFSIVQTYGQGSVDLIKNLLESIGRKDLLLRLDSGSYESTSDRWWPALINKVATLAAATDLLGEMLNLLSSEELKRFKKLLVLETLFHEPPHVDLRLLGSAKAEQTGALLLNMYGCEAVRTAHWILKKIKSINLQSMMTFPGCKPPKPEVVSVKYLRELLCKLLAGLSHVELYKFKFLLRLRYCRVDHAWIQERDADADDLVDLILETSGQRCLHLIKDVLNQMGKSDVVRNSLKGTSLEWFLYCSDRHYTESLLKENSKVSTNLEKVQVVLQELSNKQEIHVFKKYLQISCESNLSRRFVRNYTRIFSELQDLVDLLVVVYGEFSGVVVIQTALSNMGRQDLVEKVSKLYFTPKGIHFVDQFKTELIKNVRNITEILDDLRSTGVISSKAHDSISKLPSSEQKMRKLFRGPLKSSRGKDIFYRILKDKEPYLCANLEPHLSDMERHDLVENMSKLSVSTEGTGQEVESDPSTSATDSPRFVFVWTKLQPKVRKTENQFTYSLKSDRGQFECSVSGLRWSCEHCVSFQYSFGCWEEHLERVRTLKYMPAGPLIDITVSSGRLDVVYLPHWVCIDNLDTQKKLAVLHIDDCGDTVEKATKVTSSHVKLLEPIFSPRAVLIKLGLPVKVYCSLLIYKKPTAFLTLHVYLIPRDPGLKESFNRSKQHRGYSIIEKPHPDKSLKMGKKYVLKAHEKTFEITPQKLTLRCLPNFYEVYTQNPDFDFKLELTQENELEPVWSGTIRQDDYRERIPAVPRPQGIHFVDKFQTELIQRVSNIAEILDLLKSARVIGSEAYDTISKLSTSQEKMRELFRGPLKSSGDEGKDIFYTILKDKEPYLCASLERLC